MPDQIRIDYLRSLPPGLETLRSEAIRQGFGFKDRLAADWASGANTFSRPGECFLGVFADGRLIAVGGLNVDPYGRRAGIGRLRHLYVCSDWRRKGLGRMLVDRLLDEAREAFDEVRLRTTTDRAASFYVRCGFSPVKDATASHAVRLA
jgi:GNAT superfamily N-acetyltransferase